MEDVILKESASEQISDIFVVVTAGIGLLLSTLDTGIMNVAIPTLVRVFHSTVTGIAWTITLYTLALTGTIVLFGRLSDKIGHLQVFTWGLVVFAASSVMCGLSQSAPELIAFRIVQGIGAGMLQATSAAIITTIIPTARRGPALGTLGVLMGLGPVLGPTVGGALISFASWRWIFWMNIPIVVTGLLGCVRLRKVVSATHKSIQLNLPGNMLLSLSLFSLLESVSVWSTAGKSHWIALGLLAVCVMLMVIFVAREQRVAQPIIELGLFRNSSFATAMLAVFFFGGATSLGFIVPPYFLEGVRHLAPWKAGIVNLSAPLGLMLLSRMSGKLLRRLGGKPLMVAGITVMGCSYGLLSFMRADWSPMVIGGLLFVYGVGSGIFVPANLATIMGAVGRERQGTIGAVQRMVQNLGIAVDTALAAALIEAHATRGAAQLMNGFRSAWGYAAITLLASLALLVLADMRKQAV